MMLTSRQSALASPDKRQQQRIDQLLTGTRSLLNKYLNPEQLVALEREVGGAAQPPRRSLRSQPAQSRQPSNRLAMQGGSPQPPAWAAALWAACSGRCGTDLAVHPSVPRVGAPQLSQELMRKPSVMPTSSETGIDTASATGTVRSREAAYG